MTPGRPSGIDWKRVKGVVFDLDGTLYDQRGLRLRMLLELAGHIFRSRHAVRDIRVLSRFRKAREELSAAGADNISRRQLDMTAEKLSLPPAVVEEIAAEWLYRRPLKHLSACRFTEADVFFGLLRNRGVKIGVFSDYPVEEKLAALGLRADAICYSLEPGLDRLKPQTPGLEAVLARLSLNKKDCVFIGDRDELDGECARRLGMPFLLRRGHDFYTDAVSEFSRAFRQEK